MEPVSQVYISFATQVAAELTAAAVAAIAKRAGRKPGPGARRKVIEACFKGALLELLMGLPDSSEVDFKYIFQEFFAIETVRREFVKVIDIDGEPIRIDVLRNAFKQAGFDEATLPLHLDEIVERFIKAFEVEALKDNHLYRIINQRKMDALVDVGKRSAIAEEHSLTFQERSLNIQERIAHGLECWPEPTIESNAWMARPFGVTIGDHDAGRLLQIRHQVEKAFETGAYCRFLTSQGYQHSVQVVCYIDQILRHSIATRLRLAPIEAFCLAAAVFLHDIGLQYPEHHGQDCASILDSHPKRTAAYVRANRAALGFSTEDNTLIDVISIICEAHHPLCTNIPVPSEIYYGSTIIRTRLLASLLCLGNLLHLSISRAPYGVSELRNLSDTPEGWYHWVRNHFVEGVALTRLSETKHSLKIVVSVKVSNEDNDGAVVKDIIEKQLGENLMTSELLALLGEGFEEPISMHLEVRIRVDPEQDNIPSRVIKFLSYQKLFPFPDEKKERLPTLANLSEMLSYEMLKQNYVVVCNSIRQYFSTCLQYAMGPMGNIQQDTRQFMRYTIPRIWPLHLIAAIEFALDFPVDHAARPHAQLHVWALAEYLDKVAITVRDIDYDEIANKLRENELLEESHGASEGRLVDCIALLFRSKTIDLTGIRVVDGISWDCIRILLDGGYVDDIDLLLKAARHSRSLKMANRVLSDVFLKWRNNKRLEEIIASLKGR